MSVRSRLSTTNFRGVQVPRTLGFLLAGAGIAGSPIVANLRPVGAAGWASVGALLVVLSVGVLDDLAGEGPRGLRNHLRALAAGRMTTGLLKATVILGSAIAVVSLGPARRAPDALAAVLLVAASANLANSLDLRPGRTLKVFLPLIGIGLVAAPVALQPALPGLALAGVPALFRDLAERDMLGDGGSNLVGFAAGLGLALALPSWALPAAAVVAVTLNLVAEVTSLSRLIERTPLLRSLDRLGRRPV